MNVFVPSEREPDVDGIFIGKDKGEEGPAAQKTEEPVEYVAEEPGVGQPNMEKQLRKQSDNIGILST